ncbi:type IV pilus biogenesis protein PilP [Maridesulfovibrio ferrireducens]|uniref:Type IV pilus biogenesis protein PilP n=1 Tax=Maridesulfovibrio ferrireducens TaxID=246191 RepID=A0A1G9ENV4_9BACT|nr:hypothetical protein [Maridesulfovibrio ferrireducens]SDK77695.1 type IV pilus biogenesis protein PilP [Maridesulfovibrio ferrireducens]
MPNIKKLKGSRLIWICAFILIAVIAGAGTIMFNSYKMQADTNVVDELVVFNATQSNMTAFNRNKTSAFTQSSNGTFETGISTGNSSSTDAASTSFFEALSNGTTEISAQTEESRVDLNMNNPIGNSTNHSIGNSTNENKKNKSSETRITPLSYFTSLRSHLELKKLEVAIAEQEQKLIKLHTPDPAVIKAIQQTPARKKQYRPVWPKIISIQGVDGRLSATLSSSAGVQTVKTGSNAGPGKVASITPSTVLIRFNGKNVPLKFKE